MSELTVDQKYQIVTRGLQEVLGSEEHIRKILDQRPFKIYWGTAPTNSIHIGYFVPILKIADFLKAGCEVTILIADLHAFLDNMKSSMNQLKLRSDYYETMIKTVLTSLNIDITKLKFVRGTEYQLTPQYTMDVYKLNSLTNLSHAKHAGAEVVKQSDNPPITGLLYPGLQALDEQYLDVDAQLGGVDQRKIFTFAIEKLPKIGYKKRIHFMTPMVPGLRFKKKEESDNNIQLDKMSASNLDSKIDLLDGKNAVKKKINSSYCLPGDVVDNTPLILLEKIIFPILGHLGKTFIINRAEKFGGPIEFKNFEDVKTSFASEDLHPGDLKFGIIDNLNSILNPIREVFSSKEMQKLVRDAYKPKR